MATINSDPQNEGTAQLMMVKRKYGFINLQMPEDSADPWQYNVSSFPTTFVLNAEGKLLFTHTGYFGGCEQQLESEIAPLLSRAGKKDNSATIQETR